MCFYNDKKGAGRAHDFSSVTLFHQKGRFCDLENCSRQGDAAASNAPSSRFAQSSVGDESLYRNSGSDGDSACSSSVDKKVSKWLPPSLSGLTAW